MLLCSHFLSRFGRGGKQNIWRALIRKGRWAIFLLAFSSSPPNHYLWTGSRFNTRGDIMGWRCSLQASLSCHFYDAVFFLNCSSTADTWQYLRWWKRNEVRDKYFATVLDVYGGTYFSDDFLFFLHTFEIRWLYFLLPIFGGLGDKIGFFPPAQMMTDDKKRRLRSWLIEILGIYKV